MRSPALVLFAALCLFAQPSRDSYRTAFRQWRQLDPNLERDASLAGAQLASRAQKAAAAAAAYESARKRFLSEMVAANERKFAWLETPAPEAPASLNQGAQNFIASETKAVRHSLDVYAGDPDAGIRQLRAMLERESAALTSLNNAVADREKAAATVQAATATLQETRLRAVEEYRAIAGEWKDAAAETDHESAAWGEYYQLLASGAGGIGPAAPSATVSSATASSTTASPAAPEPIVMPKPSITPLPLIRYTGAWTFPVTNGLYHGPQPEFADLVVHEQNGRADGTLFARFKVSGGGDPVLRFDFTGDFKNTRTQVFALETSDGAKGTLELIPGPAFNLLEINFQIPDSKAGKIREGNMLLVKK